MSHYKEREEKICLNCNAVVMGRYCQVCGQENVEPKESVWHLVGHFIGDITHFDGKFFSSMRYLLFRPGFLSKEYIAGRRASHLHPIRMYVFTSFLFFFLFFLIVPMGGDEHNPVNLQRPKKPETISFHLSKGNGPSQTSVLPADSVPSAEKESFGFMHVRNSVGASCKTVHEYDSLQKVLPRGIRDGYLTHILQRRYLYLSEKYAGDRALFFEDIVHYINHHIPQLFFFSLPFFALILKVLYWRNKGLYYYNHSIFTLHLYCSSFIVILLCLLTGMAIGWVSGGDADWMNGVCFIALWLFWYKSFRNFYGQGRFKTFIKLNLAAFLSFIVMMLLLVALFFLSIFSI